MNKLDMKNNATIIRTAVTKLKTRNVNANYDKCEANKTEEKQLYLIGH